MPTTYAAAGTSAVTGDPDALEDLARQCRRAAGGLRSDVSMLRDAGSVPDWSGRAATAFTRSVHGLPRDLTRAADSYDTVSRALTTYAADLRVALERARRADTELERLDGMLLVDRQLLVGPVGDPQADAVRARRMALCEEEQQAVRRRLAALADDVVLSASTAACRVRSACDAPQQPPNLFERLVDSAGDWVEAHATVLTDISFALKSIASIAGTLAVVPGLGAVCGPLAVAAGVAALCLDAALASRRRASWVGVGVDAAFAALPGAGHLGKMAVREIRTRRNSVVVLRVEGTPNTRVVLDDDRNVRFQGRSMLYLNFGQEQRARDFYAQKVRGGLPDPRIKSFRVPKAHRDRIRALAVDQENDLSGHRPHLVDTTRAPDQFGLRRWDFRELERTILPGSGRIVR